MTEKTVSWVSDIGDPTDRGVRYINVAFTDGDTGFIGKKEYDAALEVHGLLTEAKDKPTDFILEDTGKQNNKGKAKYKIKGIGTYQPTPYVQGSGSPNAAAGRDSSPERSDDIRRAVAIKAAAVWAHGGTYNDLERAYHFIDGLLQEPSVRVEANTGEGAGSPTGHQKHDADSAVGQVAEGEADACPPHSPDASATPNKLGRVPCVACGVFVKTVPENRNAAVR